MDVWPAVAKFPSSLGDATGCTAGESKVLLGEIKVTRLYEIMKTDCQCLILISLKLVSCRVLEL